MYETSLVNAEENESVLAVHSLIHRYGTDRERTRINKHLDAVDIVALSPVPSPSKPALPTPSAPPHLMAIISIGKQIEMLERSAHQKTATVEFVTSVVNTMLRVLLC